MCTVQCVHCSLHRSFRLFDIAFVDLNLNPAFLHTNTQINTYNENRLRLHELFQMSENRSGRCFFFSSMRNKRKVCSLAVCDQCCVCVWVFSSFDAETFPFYSQKVYRAHSTFRAVLMRLSWLAKITFDEKDYLPYISIYKYMNVNMLTNQLCWCNSINYDFYRSFDDDDDGNHKKCMALVKFLIKTHRLRWVFLFIFRFFSIWREFSPLLLLLLQQSKWICIGTDHRSTFISVYKLQPEPNRFPVHPSSKVILLYISNIIKIINSTSILSFIRIAFSIKHVTNIQFNNRL